jgi:acyl-coenzyme A thioesterase PaaI-like protein
MASMPTDIHEQPTCFGCGEDNPAGLHADFVPHDDEVIGTMVVTETMVGAPRRLHGGIMMAFFDEGMGLVGHHLGADVMTASLTIDLRAPAYLGAVLTQRAWLERHERRKWFIRGEVHEGEQLLAEAHGLWIEPRVHPPGAVVPP